jgi:DNA-binding LacI/PurR family transcriptional regulator
VIKLAKVTLESISSVLNVSQNTVSKALRGVPGVSDELREKIFNLASEMGYKKLQQSNDNSLNNITVLCRNSFLSDATFWSQVLYGISNYASNNNIKLSIVSIDENKEDKPETISSIMSHISDGFIIAGTINNTLLMKIKASNLPFIVVDHFSEEIECDYVNISNKLGIYKVIYHIYEKGHRSIGFISNSISAYSFIERYEAYLKYMKDFKLPVYDEFLWMEAEYIKTDYFKNKISSLIKNKNFPTAWICVNDNTALTFIKALNEMGISVPEDISVVGFDNISELLYTELTTIDVPKQSIGQKAVEQLIYRIENPNSPFEDIMLSVHLIERNSVKNLL